MAPTAEDTTEEEEENYDHDDDEDEVDSQRGANRAAHKFPSSTDAAARSNILLSISELFPDTIHLDNTGRSKSLTTPEGHPKLIISPDWANSWFLSPPVQNHPDTVGYWPNDTKFPYVGSDMARVPDDSKDTISIKIPKNHAAPLADYLFKQNLLDNLITDTLIERTDDLVNLALKFPKENYNMGYKDIIESLLTQLSMIQKTNTLSAASNLRSHHGILASICKNKLILREEVLAASKGGSGSAFAKQCLKGSHFFTPDLFGPVPESLLKSIVHNPAYAPTKSRCLLRQIVHEL